MSVIFGTTNTDGTGSAADLNEENGILVNDDYQQDGVNINVTDEDELGFSFSEIEADTSVWNSPKEVKVEGSTDEVIQINNFVDVYIDNQSDLGHSQLDVLNVKRAFINTAGVDSDDSIMIGVKSNSVQWSNLFEVSTGEGNDAVSMMNIENSKYTEFDINLGNGNDKFDFSNLELAEYQSQLRHVDGGEGLDVLYTNGDANLTFEGFEVVQGKGQGVDSVLEMDAAALANNADSEFGLIVADLDVEMGEGVESYTVSELSASQADHLGDEGFDSSEFTAVTFTTESGDEFTILTDDADFLV
ncbi:hypothetical protein AB2S62_17125 [Vibrio sp. NTOU-M3]|uniref:hypothetical protein n=1 Tax=Vibrio sp. NTOU-M3 TaxID=3234954 RepID=UPI00349F8E7F